MRPVDLHPIPGNVNNWYYTIDELNHTPTIMEGVTIDEERLLRFKGTSLIADISKPLKVSQIVTATACNFFQRYYMRRSIKKNHHYEIAAACFYLATKTEEYTRHLDDIVVEVIRRCQKNSSLKVNMEDKEAKTWLKIIKFKEEDVMIALCFDLAVELPYDPFLAWCEKFQYSVTLSKLTWAIINDSCKTVICLLYTPKVIAATSLYLAAKNILEKDDIQALEDEWWIKLGVDMDDILGAAKFLQTFYNVG